MKKILCILLCAATIAVACSCAREENEAEEEKYIPYEETDYEVTRKPLAAPGELMNVRISAEPGEDPFHVGADACPDPFVTYDNKTDYYYGLCTQNSKIELHRSKKLADLFLNGECTVVYRTGKEIYECLWAPEMYFMDGKWYIYSSGMVSENDSTKRLIVLESENDDPFEGFHFKAFIDKTVFGIDPTVYQDKSHGKNYICFSQVIDGLQWLSIAELTNPWTMKNVTPISDPRDYEWESLSNGPLDEGPFFVTKNERLFIIFSANGCYSDYYRLGVLELTDNKLLSKESWTKHDKWIFMLNRDNKVFAPGHASFFYSPDHSEIWVAYHCFYTTNSGNKRRMRVCQVQPVDFDETGFPVMGKPLANGTMIPVPSGE